VFKTDYFIANSCVHKGLRQHFINPLAFLAGGDSKDMAESARSGIFDPMLHGSSPIRNHSTRALQGSFVGSYELSQLSRQKRARAGSISGRLRSASDLEERGVIDRTQKGVLKDLIICGDAELQTALDAYERGDPSGLEALMQRGLLNRRDSLDLLQDLDFAFLNVELGSTPKDDSASVFQDGGGSMRSDKMQPMEIGSTDRSGGIAAGSFGAAAGAIAANNTSNGLARSLAGVRRNSSVIDPPFDLDEMTFDAAFDDDYDHRTPNGNDSAECGDGEEGGAGDDEATEGGAKAGADRGEDAHGAEGEVRSSGSANDEADRLDGSPGAAAAAASAAASVSAAATGGSSSGSGDRSVGGGVGSMEAKGGGSGSAALSASVGGGGDGGGDAMSLPTDRMGELPLPKLDAPGSLSFSPQFPFSFGDDHILDLGGRGKDDLPDLDSLAELAAR
ncbi:unnamed protein product, partial [Phaeothamnion confervicola]